MNRATSKRSSENPLGDTSLAYIRAANCMVSRTVLFCLVASARDVRFIVEQPATSVMPHHPKFAHMLALSRDGVLPLSQVFTWFGMFGGTSPKPTKLWGTPTWLSQLARKLDRNIAWSVTTANRYTDAGGTRRVTGTSDLKGTQAYPDGYGEAVAALWRDSSPHLAGGCGQPVLAVTAGSGSLSGGQASRTLSGGPARGGGCPAARTLSGGSGGHNCPEPLVSVGAAALVCAGMVPDDQAWADLDITGVLRVLRGGGLRVAAPCKGMLLGGLPQIVALPASV